MAKNLKFFSNVCFDSSKEASWGTERSAKITGPCQVQLMRKSRKTSKNANFPQKFQFMGHFDGFS